MNTQNTDLQASDVADVMDASDITDIEDVEVASGAAEAEAETTEVANMPKPPAMQILRIKNCESLSGRSMLTYHIGISKASTASEASIASTADDASTASQASPELHLRLFANTARGYFCKDWISLTLLELLLSESKTFASSTVQRLCFEGKSVNSGGFVLAALRHEGLVRAIPGSLRSYERLDSSAWQQEIAGLIAAGVSLSENAMPVVATPVAAKKPSSKARSTKKASKS